jgi:hypothetical protein
MHEEASCHTHSDCIVVQVAGADLYRQTVGKAGRAASIAPDVPGLQEEVAALSYTDCGVCTTDGAVPGGRLSSFHVHIEG